MPSLFNLKPKTSWKEAVSVYLQPKVISMLFLGFAAGLPFLLVFGTLSAWLTTEDISRSVIGFFSWVGLTYSIKVLWAPVVDRTPLPFLDKWLGRRRGWMFLAQFGIIAGLIGMAGISPSENITGMALFALVVAFSSATQDVALDAYRIEIIDKEYQGAMAAMYIGGYRLGLLVAGAGALYLGKYMGWSMAYLIMASCMLVGIITVLMVREPIVKNNTNVYEREEKVIEYLENSAHLPELWRKPVAWFIGAVVCPFTDFFQRNGSMALIILLFISVFRISDITMGVMANAFYIDMGYDLAEIANITKFFGFFMTLFGAALGGILIVRFGIMRPLLLGAVLVAS
ncbi:MAG: MFS transporter, partial [Kangiella sp.]|nr:MFS transporter [Kangiella sp.]